MKRLTDKQVEHQRTGRARIREAAKDARNTLDLRLHTFTGTSFVQLGQFQPFNWINGITILKFPSDYTII